MYSVKISNNAEIVRNYVPAKRNSDNVIGMYDKVTNTFFTNQGSGTFIAGPEITGIAAVSYVDGMYEAINNKKMAKLTANSIEYTNDSTSAGVVTSVVGAGDKLRVTRKPVTIPVVDTNNNNSVQAQAQIWVD